VKEDGEMQGYIYSQVDVDGKRMSRHSIVVVFAWGFASLYCILESEYTKRHLILIPFYQIH
jgi:hypothetical protein